MTLNKEAAGSDKNKFSSLLDVTEMKRQRTVADMSLLTT